MSRKIIILVIALTSVSLIAALITQLLWVRNAWYLKEDQFITKVEIALKSVVNQLLTSSQFPPADPALFDPGFYTEHQSLLKMVNPDILDSLMTEELNMVRIGSGNPYGVYREDDGEFIMGNYRGYAGQLLESPYKMSLSCLCEDHIYYLAIFFPKRDFMIISEMIILPVMSGLFLMILIFSFFFTIFSLIRQKKLSEMKTDFVNNMTHEFKTPISTISISSEMLVKDQVIESPERIRKYAKIIFDENSRLKNLVDRVLQIATLEKGNVNLKIREVDVHEVIRESIETFMIQFTERGVSLVVELNARSTRISADRIHLFNVINNLIDNAIKYSVENPEIFISTTNQNDQVRIHVRDNGIGITPENQPHVFKKFHRLQTGDIHDAKGFGIGLFYAKTILEKMGATISMQSSLNQGSTFSIIFPLKSL